MYELVVRPIEIIADEAEIPLLAVFKQVCDHSH